MSSFDNYNNELILTKEAQEYFKRRNHTLFVRQLFFVTIMVVFFYFYSKGF